MKKDSFSTALMFLSFAFYCSGIYFLLFQNTIPALILMIVHGLLFLIVLIRKDSGRDTISEAEEFNRYFEPEQSITVSSDPDKQVPEDSDDLPEPEAVTVSDEVADDNVIVCETIESSDSIILSEEPVADAEPASCNAEESPSADDSPDITIRSDSPVHGANIIPHAGADEKTSTIDILSVARGVTAELKSIASSVGIRFQIVSSEESVFVKADAERIRILFRNIIDNSIKYMGKAGVLSITVSTIDDDIFIVCKDNGYGLDANETTHIFELNYQGSNRISGNGLGLAQAKAIVEAYGGTVYARSRPNQGMGIYIQIPAVV